jgi:hypothetical protein
VGIGTKNADRNTKALAKEAHSFKTFLIIGATTANKNLDAVVNELILVFFESMDDTLEGSSNVGEVGNTTTDNEDLAIRARSSTGEKINFW